MPPPNAAWTATMVVTVSITLSVMCAAGESAMAASMAKASATQLHKLQGTLSGRSAALLLRFQPSDPIDLRGGVGQRRPAAASRPTAVGLNITHRLVINIVPCIHKSQKRKPYPAGSSRGYDFPLIHCRFKAYSTLSSFFSSSFFSVLAANSLPPIPKAIANAIATAATSRINASFTMAVAIPS